MRINHRTMPIEEWQPLLQQILEGYRNTRCCTLGETRLAEPTKNMARLKQSRNQWHAVVTQASLSSASDKNRDRVANEMESVLLRRDGGARILRCQKFARESSHPPSPTPEIAHDGATLKNFLCPPIIHLQQISSTLMHLCRPGWSSPRLPSF